MKSKKSKIIYIIFNIALLLVLIISLQRLIVDKKEPVNEIKPTPIEVEPEKEEPNLEYQKIISQIKEKTDFSSIQEKHHNNEIIARLEIPNMFNILVAKTKDNIYYLNHNIDRRKDQKGSEYFDFRTNPTDKQINVYGHNSRTFDIPFRKLEKFKNKEFFDNNPYIILESKEGIRIYKILSIKEVNRKDDEHMQIPKKNSEYKKHIDILNTNVINKRDIKYDNDSNLLILQTCSYNGKDNLYVITSIELKP